MPSIRRPPVPVFSSRRRRGNWATTMVSALMVTSRAMLLTTSGRPLRVRYCTRVESKVA